jgi:hypothetical protein
MYIDFDDVEQLLTERQFAEERLAEQKLAEQKLAEQRLAERFVEQRLAEQRMTERQSAARESTAQDWPERPMFGVQLNASSDEGEPDTEITLGASKLVVLVVGLLLLCGLSFGVGYSMGKHSGLPVAPAQARAIEAAPPSSRASVKPSAAPRLTSQPQRNVEALLSPEITGSASTSGAQKSDSASTDAASSSAPVAAGTKSTKQ